jgi:hypothetical protein
MRKFTKHLFAAAIVLRCFFAPQSSCGGGEEVFLILAPQSFEILALAVYGTFEMLIPLEWMEPGTVSDFLTPAPSRSTDGDGTVWPLGLGFFFPQGQFPGEATSVALADIGAFTIRHANIYGVQAAGVVAATTDTCAGISVGGFSSAADTVYGIQVGGLLSSCRSDIYGIQVAGYANDTPGLCAGMQAGTVNMAGEVCGAQIGLTNCARDASGMQIGVVNVAQNMQGVQIGLINVIKNNGMFPSSPFINMGF